MSDEFYPSWSLDRRRQLRRDQTTEEQMLWDFLKARQLAGEKFRRQCGLGPYIVDFYCARVRLIIELDGSVHDTPEAQEYDLEREFELFHQGYKIIRFKNLQIRDHIPHVLKSIQDAIRECDTENCTPPLLPLGGG